MKIIKNKQLQPLADSLFSTISSKKDPFLTTIVVCPNILMQQWLKAYWLKTQGENILMNTSFKTMSDVLPLLVAQQNYKPIKHSALRQIILNILINDSKKIIPDDKKVYYKDSPVKLFDFASSLASLFLNYYLDDFSNMSEYQKALYKKIIEECEKHNLGTIERPIPFDGQRNTIYFFGFSKLDKVYEELLNKCDFVEYYSCEIDGGVNTEYSISKAPSMVREVEFIHSEICKKLMEGASMSDFLVVGPGIVSYKNTIERVFRQNDEEYPSIPFVISYHGKEDTDVVAALKLLFEIYKNGFFTRLDFYQLITNPVVQQVRGISVEEIDNWMKTVVNLNIYRNHDYLDDWIYLKKRLVLSKVSSVNFMSDNLVSLKDGDYLPYTNIGFDDDSIVRLIKIIDDIYSLIALLKQNDIANSNQMDAIKVELDKWFSYSDGEVETNPLYKKLLSSIETMKTINPNGLPLDVFFYTLFSDGLVNVIQRGNGFSQGITFVDLDINAIYPTKYIFFINASSNNTPIPIIKSELDERPNVESSDDPITFSLLYQNASEKLYISYVFEDLKTEEEFYLAPYIVEMDKSKNKLIEGKKVYRIPLDEKRAYSELFTRKEFNDKKYFNQLLNGALTLSTRKAVAKDEEIKPILRESLSVSEMANYLQEPLSYKANKLFNNVDETPKKIRDEWEPFSIDILTNGALIKKIILELINKSFDYEKTYQELKRSNLLPTVNEDYEKGLYKKMVETAKTNLDFIVSGSNNKYELVEPQNLKMTIKTKDDEGKEKDLEWMLMSSSYHCVSVEGNKRKYYEVIDMTTRAAEHKFLKAYIMSLMDVATLDDDEYEITIARVNREKSFKITPKRAKELLNSIYLVINDYSHNAVAPLDLDKAPETYGKLLEKIFDEHGEWKCFDHSKMFDLENGIGYDSNNYKQIDFINEVKRQQDLIEYFKSIEEEDKDEQ